jgi:hypothetical protein
MTHPAEDAAAIRTIADAWSAALEGKNIQRRDALAQPPRTRVAALQFRHRPRRPIPQAA